MTNDSKLSWFQRLLGNRSARPDMKKEPKNEQVICVGLMQLISERRCESVTPTCQPDTIERSRPAVEWLFETATAKFAIEHTRIESFPNQIIDGKHFARMLEPLETELTGQLPGHYFLVVNVGAAKAPVSRHDEIRAAIRDWILANCIGLKEEEGLRGTPTGVPFEIALSRDIGGGSSLTVFQGLVDNLADLRFDRIREALDRKCPKLSAEQRAGRITVLALESDDMPLINRRAVSAAVVEALASRTDSPDLIFWVRTSTQPWNTWLLKEGASSYPAVPNDGPFVLR